jgi:hypothetical protein
MTEVEKRFGGKVIVRLDPIREILTAKMMADARDLIAMLSKAETMGDYEEEVRLLSEFQAAHRSLHVLNGTLHVSGEAIPIPPKTQGSISAPDRTAENTGELAVAQALNGVDALNEAESDEAGGLPKTADGPQV